MEATDARVRLPRRGPRRLVEVQGPAALRSVRVLRGLYTKFYYSIGQFVKTKIDSIFSK